MNTRARHTQFMKQVTNISKRHGDNKEQFSSSDSCRYVSITAFFRTLPARLVMQPQFAHQQQLGAKHVQCRKYL